MPSFDIVSEIESAELLNAAQNTEREIANRFDFRKVETEITFQSDVISITTESDFQCLQIIDILRAQLIKRKIDPLTMDFDSTPVHRGKTYTIAVKFKQGIETPVAKKIVKTIKDSKIKVQTAIQGEQVRVTGKKRDDLQQVMSLIREAELGQPFQFNNFRD